MFVASGNVISYSDHEKPIKKNSCSLFYNYIFWPPTFNNGSRQSLPIQDIYLGLRKL